MLFLSSTVTLIYRSEFHYPFCGTPFANFPAEY
jgi:hypothetical protein